MKEVAFMSGEIKQIAERMRAVRIDSAYTYQEAAKLLEIPPEEYLLYESGEIDIPISILLKISAVFNIDRPFNWLRSKASNLFFSQKGSGIRSQP